MTVIINTQVSEANPPNTTWTGATPPNTQIAASPSAATPSGSTSNASSGTRATSVQSVRQAGTARPSGDGVSQPSPNATSASSNPTRTRPGRRRNASPAGPTSGFGFCPRRGSDAMAGAGSLRGPASSTAGPH